jgi:hypothetical protein
MQGMQLHRDAHSPGRGVVRVFCTALWPGSASASVMEKILDHFMSK